MVKKFIYALFFNHFGSIMEKGIAACSEAFSIYRGKHLSSGNLKINLNGTEKNGTASDKNCSITLLVAGSPNVGKSTFFNVITGKTVSVANWPGTTVEKKEAMIEYNGERICLVDLPGAYNLYSISLEEKITLNELLFGKYDAIVILADTLSLTKSLYFAIQVLELTKKAVLALTKYDEAHSKGIHLRPDGIQQALGIPTVPISSITGLGIDRLLEEAIKATEVEAGSMELRYPTLENSIEKIREALEKKHFELPWNARWIAIKLLEQEEVVSNYVYSIYGEDLRLLVENEIKEYIEKYNRSPREAIIDYRYDFVEGIVEKNVKFLEISKKGNGALERIMLNPLLGPLASTGIYLVVFFLAFTLNTGFPLNLILSSLGYERWAGILESYSISGILSSAFNYIADIARSSLGVYLPSVVVSLISDGIIPGVGSVLSFLPLIMVSIAFLAVLEDTGIGARMAIAYDAILNKFGLTGKSVFPILLGLGCNVPAVMSTRAIEDSTERKALIYSVPFIPCQARLVIMMALTAAFFTPLAGTFALITAYMISLLAMLFTARVIKKIYSIKGEAQGLIVELPPLHKPIWRVIWWHVWDNSKHFLKKAGTIIFALSIVIWVTLSYTPSLTIVSSPEESIAFHISSLLSPISKLYGLSGDVAWETAFMFFNGFIAKESFVESVVLFHPEASSLNEAVALMGYTVPQALAILIAANLYVPCVATLASMYGETKSFKGIIMYLTYSVLLAIAVSYLIYLLLGLLI